MIRRVNETFKAYFFFEWGQSLTHHCIMKTQIKYMPNPKLSLRRKKKLERSNVPKF